METAAGSRKSILREYYEALLIAIIFVNFAKIFAFQAFKIPTGSMVDNLLVGDHILVNKYIFGSEGAELFGPLLGFRQINRGDIIVFRYPVDPSIDFVKRVVGLPGETVVIRDKHVYVDGRAISEPYTLFLDPNTFPRRPALPEAARDQFGPYHVPEDSYFVMGDNRDRSNDSRYWGTVPRELIKGKPILVYWSYRGIPPPQGSPPRERFRQLKDVVLHFWSRTRWDRTFFIIDSRYHYHTEPALAPASPRQISEPVDSRSRRLTPHPTPIAERNPLH